MDFELADILLFSLYAITTVLILSKNRQAVFEAKRSADSAVRSAGAAEASAKSAAHTIQLGWIQLREKFVQAMVERYHTAKGQGRNREEAAIGVLQNLPAELHDEVDLMLRAYTSRLGISGPVLRNAQTKAKEMLAFYSGPADEE